MRCEAFICQKESRLPEELCEGWCEGVVEDGFGLCERVGRTSRGYHAHRKAEVEEADDSSNSSGKETLGVASLLMEVNNLEVEEDLSTVATLFWAEGVWMERWKKAAEGVEVRDP